MIPDPSPAIRARGLAKRFDKVQAVSAVDFEVQSGELFGFLGPNGAGKTTTINMLTGLARAGMFFVKTGSDLSSIPEVLPGVMAVSILFGTTSMLAVTITFEKKNRSFERLLLAPLSFEILMLARTSGAVLFGILNALVPLFLALWLTDLSQVAWGVLVPAVFLISVASTFMGLICCTAPCAENILCRICWTWLFSPYSASACLRPAWPTYGDGGLPEKVVIGKMQAHTWQQSEP